MKFHYVILAIAFWHQYQREEKTTFVAGQEVKYIEATIDDYRIAYELFVNGILQNSLSSMPKMIRDTHAAIIKMRKQIAKLEKRSEKDVLFTRKMICEFTGFTMAQVRDYCQELETYEILELVAGGKGGKGKTYRLLEEDLEKVDLSMIPTPEELAEMIKNDENGQKRG